MAFCCPGLMPGRCPRPAFLPPNGARPLGSPCCVRKDWLRLRAGREDGRGLWPRRENGLRLRAGREDRRCLRTSCRLLPRASGWLLARALAARILALSARVCTLRAGTRIA